jgi:hypothetical protein
MDIIQTPVAPCGGAASGKKSAQTSAITPVCSSVIVDVANGTLTVVEPFVSQSYGEIVSRSKNVSLLEAKSQEALPLLEGPVDAVLLEGDLNYHTVYGDLSGWRTWPDRQGAPFPLIFLRATGGLTPQA